MSTRIHSFVNILILAFLYACSKILSDTKITKYSRFDSLDGRTCTAGNIVFDEENVVSVTECLKFCSSQTSCAGVSYRQSTQECIGCNKQIYVSFDSVNFENSLFFRLDECPSNNGRMQLDVNFRLQIYTTEKNQTEAELDCRREPNRHLVIFDEEWKINAVESMLMLCAGYHLKDYWIDGTRQNILTDWKFTDGRNILMSQTIFWHMDNPDSPNENKSCLRLKYRGTVDRYRLDDRKCGVWNPCEY